MGQMYDTWLQSRGAGNGLPPGTRTRDPEAVDMYQTLVRSVGRYRTAAGARLSRQEIQMIEAQLDIARLNSDMIESLHDVDASNADSVRRQLVSYRIALMDNRTDLAEQRNQFNNRLMAHVDDEHRRGANPDSAAWTALSGGLFDGPETTAADVEIPNLLLAMRDRGYGGVSFDYDPTDGFTNLEISYSGSLRTNIERMFARAQSVHRNQSSAEGAVDGNLATIGAPALVDDATWSTLTDAQKVDQLQASLGHVQTISDNIAESDGVSSFQTSTDLLNDLQEQDSYLRAADEDLTSLRAELFGPSATSDDQMGQGIQALRDSGWAASNGYEVGRYIDTNGDGDPDSYIEGPDDRRAMLAWRRQIRRGSGRGHGIRGASSGMWVELDVALSEDQTNHYRTDEGFAFRQVGDERVFMTAFELERETRSPPVQGFIAEVDGEAVQYLRDSQGHYYTINADGYFVNESMAGRHEEIEGYIQEGYSTDRSIGGRTIAPGEPCPPLTVQAGPHDFLYDDDLITTPGEYSNFRDWDAGRFTPLGFYGTPGTEEYADTLDESRTALREQLGIQFTSEEDFRENKTHRVVGLLSRMNASDDMEYGPGVVMVNGRPYTADQIVGEVRVVSRRSRATPRQIIHQIRANNIAEELGYGTTGDPTPPRVFNHGVTALRDEAEIRDNLYDRISTEVGNLPERPSRAAIRIQRARDTAEDLSGLETSLSQAEIDLSAVQDQIDALDAETTEPTPESDAERQRLVGQRSALRNEVAEYRRGVRRARRRSERLPEPTPEPTPDLPSDLPADEVAQAEELREAGEELAETRAEDNQARADDILARAQRGEQPTEEDLAFLRRNFPQTRTDVVDLPEFEPGEALPPEDRRTPSGEAERVLRGASVEALEDTVRRRRAQEEAERMAALGADVLGESEEVVVEGGGAGAPAPGAGTSSPSAPSAPLTEEQQQERDLEEVIEAAREEIDARPDPADSSPEPQGGEEGGEGAETDRRRGLFGLIQRRRSRAGSNVDVPTARDGV